MSVCMYVYIYRYIYIYIYREREREIDVEAACNREPVDGSRAQKGKLNCCCRRLQLSTLHMAEINSARL